MWIVSNSNHQSKTNVPNRPRLNHFFATILVLLFIWIFHKPNLTVKTKIAVSGKKNFLKKLIPFFSILLTTFLVACANFYFESYYPIHYAENTINKSLKTKNVKFIRKISHDSDRTFYYLNRSNRIKITSLDYTFSTGTAYLGSLHGTSAPSALILINKQHVGITGIIIKYSVDQIYVSE